MTLFSYFKDNYIYINKKRVKLRPLNFDEILDIMFTVIPYVKKAKDIAREAKSNSDWQTFKMLSEILLEDINKDQIKHIFSILLNIPEAEIGQIKSNDILMALPAAIKLNNLYTIYMTLQRIAENE